MALKVKRDADNKWYVYIDWNQWIDAQAVTTPNGPGLAVAISNVTWASPVAIVEETETPSDDVSGITFFYGSGGVNGTTYNLTATVTYSTDDPAATDMTQNKTIEFSLEAH